MASSKKKKPSILRRLAISDSDCAVSDSDGISISDTLSFDFKDEREIPDEVHKTACSEAANVLSRMATFDRNAKSNLYKVYEEIEDIVKSKHFFPEINEELTAEFGDIIKLVHKQKADVCEDICPIVITGETSAGKSTFVNLLLGVELLPQSPLTCTSPICRISNGDNKRILLTDSEDKQHNLNLADIQGVEEMRILLKDYICATEAGEKYKAVDICWPIPCLQSKIMIVDTPGISPDNDILATRLFEYLPSALAFIYIINPTNAGGVQSDRLQRILDEQERRICRGVKTVFDPRRAIFVCNKWDQMHEDEEKVFNHIKEKLSNKWTNFDSSKMYKISAWEEMQRSKNDQPISDNFKALLKGIDQMIPACLHEKIFRHASWQRYFLDRLNFKLAARMINARRTEDEKKMMAKQVMKRVQKVRENITAVQSKLKGVATDQCLKRAEQLYHYLHLPGTQNKLCSWTEDDLPENDDIDKIHTELMCLVEECIAREIKTWLKETSNGGLPEFMEEKLKKECSIIESECTEIDNTILGQSFSTCELGMTSTWESEKDKSFLTKIPLRYKVAILVTFPLWAPLSLVVGLFAIPYGIKYFSNESIKNRRSVRSYNENKQMCAKYVLDHMLTKIDIKFLKEKVFGQFLNEINNRIDQFCKFTIPRRISAGEILVKRIKIDIRQPHEIRKQCILVDNDFKSVYGRVLYIYMEYFDMLKLSRSYVRKKNLSNDIEVFVNGEWKDAAVKQMQWSYSNNANCSVLSEIQILRNINHKNILDVFGITFATRKKCHILQIHSEKCDKSLETVIFNSTEQDKPWRKCIHLYLCQCLEALTYLHEHDIMHGNVKPSNILIKDGIAKLADAGMHRPLLKGPIHGIALIKAQDLLRSLFYGRESDVFRFGLVLWESWYRISALNDEKESSLETYEQLSYIILEGRKPNFDGEIINKLKVLIQDCWEKDPVDRPTARNIFERLQNIRKDA